MAGRGSFSAITSADVERLLAQPPAGRWHFAHGMDAVLSILMDKAWVAIHRALSDGTLYGTLGEPPLDMAVLGDHLIGQTPLGSYLYLKHPPEVADIAQELAQLSSQEFEERLAAVPEADEDMEALGLSSVIDHIEYVWPYFEEMQAFYQRAAAEGLAVLFSWG
jgi:hypothetical protein